MNIIKYKKISNGKYKVIFEDNSSVILYEDIILKYNLIINKKISYDELNIILKENNDYLAYDLSLSYINKRMRCEKEIRDYLSNKNIEDNIIEKTINTLKKNGYINTQLYVKSFISDKIRLNNYGPNKIKKELLKLNIDSNLIDNEIKSYPKEEWNEVLSKSIDKKIKTNRSYAGSVLRKKLLTEFLNKGYYSEDIINILNDKNLNNDDLYEKEYNKLYNKYSKKYSGIELEHIINQKLYQKGLKKTQF